MVVVKQKGIKPTPVSFLVFLMEETDLLRKRVWVDERFILEKRFYDWCENYEKIVVKEDEDE